MSHLFFMDLSIVVFVLLVLPAILFTLLLTWGIKKFGKESLAINVRKYLLIAIGIGFCSIMIYDWVERNHFRSFPLNEQIEINLHIEEIESFLEAPTDFTLKIVDARGERGRFEFHTPYGSPLAFYADDQYEIIWIEGIERNEGLEWFLDYEGNEVSKWEPKESNKKPTFKLIAEFDYSNILIER